MAFKLILFLLIFNIMLGCSGPSCIKEVQFELPVTITPVKEYYNIGDTLWISMSLPLELIDNISEEPIKVGKYHFETGMNIIKLSAENWSNGSNDFQLVPNTGEIDVYGFSFPEIVPTFQFEQQLARQVWKFGIVPRSPNSEYVLIFQKRNPFGWHGTVQFENDNCHYNIAKSIYLTNDGSIDYQFYVEKYPYFTETGTEGNLADNHHDFGAFFFSVQ